MYINGIFLASIYLNDHPFLSFFLERGLYQIGIEVFLRNDEAKKWKTDLIFKKKKKSMEKLPGIVDIL